MTSVSSVTTDALEFLIVLFLVSQCWKYIHAPSYLSFHFQIKHLQELREK